MSEIKLATLIGSERAGRSFASVAASMLKKVVLELGGNDALVVFEDADLKAAAKAAADSRLRNCGQACNAAKRYLVHESVKDKFVELLKEEYNKYIPGNPKNPSVQMGPIATEEAAKTFLNQCELIERHGKLLHKVEFQFTEEETKELDAGYWVQPRLYELVDNAYCEEEIFGPAATLQTFISNEDALRLINQSRFGLGCSVWTSDVNRFNDLSASIETGNVFLNSMVRSHVGLPYGGVKDSGYGRELGEEGLRELTNIKVVYTG
jgi:succinate-semialdehyde dehydrogenase/glutarate-semialdehyde dehydrogenase